MKGIRGSEVLRAEPACKGDKADDELAALPSDGVDGEDAEVNQIKRSINDEMERFQKELLKKKDFPLNTLVQFLRDRGWKLFTHMGYIAQQGIDYPASSA